MALAKGICDYIAAHWMDIGYCLDFDEDGNQVDLIESTGHGNPKQCCTLLLKTWIQSDKSKRPKTWQTLLDILLSLDHKAAHDKVKEHLQYIQSKQQSKTPGLMAVSNPVEESGDSLQSSTTRTYSPSLNAVNNGSLSRATEGFDLHRPTGPSQD